MRWTYDAEADAMYVHLHEGRPERQVVLEDERIVVDLGPENVVIGIEILDPNRNWSLFAIRDAVELSEDDLRSLALVSTGWLLPGNTLAWHGVALQPEEAARPQHRGDVPAMPTLYPAAV